jgi:hypothetical protein
MPSDFRDKVHNLPEPVKNALLSNQIAEDMFQITTSYGLKAEQRGDVAKIVGLIFVNDIPLGQFTEVLQKQQSFSEPLAAGLAANITKKIFLLLKDYFRDAEMLSGYWSQKATPPSQKPESLGLEITGTQTATADNNIMPTTKTSSMVKKPFRLAVQENKEILNQQLTANPIKIAEFDQPVRPTIKNWLADYIKQKGSGHHDELERSDYLFKSLNATNLPPEERVKLSKMLKAYDEDIEVPISLETKLIDMEELMKKDAPKTPVAPTAPTAPVTPKPVAPLTPLTQPATPQTQQAQPTQAFSTPAAVQQPAQTLPRPIPPPLPPTPPQPRYSGADSYREKVAQEDLAGPIKPIARPEPKLDGNIIDLKNISE